jgi:membrane-bound serine protease (ClpP class)
VVGFAVKARRGRVITGREQLLGSDGEVLDEAGWARVRGERWAVRSSAPLHKGDRIRVVRMDGLTLEVEPVDRG